MADYSERDYADRETAQEQATDRQPNAVPDQQSTQQRMNAEAQRQSLQQPQQQRNFAPVQQLDPNDIRQMPGFLFPAHASDSVTRLSQRARQQERDRAQVDLPAAAQDVSPLEHQYVPMPAGGLATLANLLYPDDFGNQDAMDDHISDLLIMNRHTILNDTTYTVGTMVRVK